MTSRIFWLLCITFTLVASAEARSKSELHNVAAVFQAERLLDESAWSQTIRIHNKRPNSTFGAKVWGLAFEFGGRIWLYLPEVGAQSPAVKASQLESDKADLTDLLKRVNRGFVSYERVSPDERIIDAISKVGQVPNGCMMESLASLRKMVRSGVDVDQADLLMYYAKVGANLMGHTVLVYETDGDRFVWDPETPQLTRRLSSGYKSDALAIAKVVAESGARARVAEAHLLNIPESDMRATYVAGLDQRHFSNLVN